MVTKLKETETISASLPVKPVTPRAATAKLHLSWKIFLLLLVSAVLPLSIGTIGGLKLSAASNRQPQIDRLKLELTASGCALGIFGLIAYPIGLYLSRPMQKLIDRANQIALEQSGQSQPISTAIIQAQTEINLEVRKQQNLIKKLTQVNEFKSHQLDLVSTELQRWETAIKSIDGHNPSAIFAESQELTLNLETAVALEQTDYNLGQILSAAKSGSTQVREIAEPLPEILHLTKTIQELAQKTSLIALNAAIDATKIETKTAKFRTATEEIKRLADVTSKISAELETLIQTNQLHAGETINTLEQIVSESKSTQKTVSNSRHNIEAVVGFNQQRQQLVNTLPELCSQKTLLSLQSLAELHQKTIAQTTALTLGHRRIERLAQDTVCNLPNSDR